MLLMAQVEVIREEEEETDGKENLSVRFGGEDNLQSLDGEHSCLHGRWNRIIPALVDEVKCGMLLFMYFMLHKLNK